MWRNPPRKDLRNAESNSSLERFIFATGVRPASHVIQFRAPPFLGGGTLGPDLTHAYAKLGPRGTEAAMQTLYFGVMTPIYSEHPVVPQEQADLIALLKQSEAKPQRKWSTQILILIALLLGGVLVALTGLLWRDRVRSVRRALVDKARRQGVLS